MHRHRSGEVYVIGPVLDTWVGVPMIEDDWSVVTRPTSETWPERVWTALSDTYTALTEIDRPEVYENTTVVTASVCGWGGIELVGSALRLVCIDCGGTRGEDPIMLCDGDVPTCPECGGPEVPDIGDRDLDRAEEVVRGAESVVFVGVVPNDATLVLLDAAAGSRTALYGSPNDWPVRDVWDTVLPLSAVR